jgi:hypothetical protein
MKKRIIVLIVGSVCLLTIIAVAYQQDRPIFSLLSLISSDQALNTKTVYKIGDRLATVPTAIPHPGMLPVSKAANNIDIFIETNWDALLPKDWDPIKIFESINLSDYEDEDPRAMKALENFRAAWDHAPINSQIIGARIRIAGFVVPLESQGELTSQFLLIPYYGGCIHSPAPPANQIIHVLLKTPLPIKTMDAAWVSGVLESVRAETDMGVSGYRMWAAKVSPYETQGADFK